VWEVTTVGVPGRIRSTLFPQSLTNIRSASLQYRAARILQENFVDFMKAAQFTNDPGVLKAQAEFEEAMK